MENEVKAGDLFADKDVNRAGRIYRVVIVVTKAADGVRKDSALCVVRGKATMVAVDRLLHPSRFERVVEMKPCAMLGMHNGDGSETLGCTCPKKAEAASAAVAA